MAANNLAVLLSEDPESGEDLEKALQLAKDANQLKANEPTVQDTLGWVYYKMGDMQQAGSFLEQALAAAPENPIFNYHAGMVFYKSGRTDEARVKLAKAVERGSGLEWRDSAAAVLGELGD